MYKVLLVISFVAIAMCLSCLILCCNQKESKLVKLMILVSACAFVENVGYLLELFSTNVDTVMFALKTEYLGGAMLPHFFFMFCLVYNRIRIPKWLTAVMFGIGFFTEFCVWTCDWNHLYYTSVDFVNTGYFPHAVLGKGPYYIFYAVVLYSELLVSMIIMLRRLIQTQQKELKHNAFLLFLAAFVPVCAHVLCICNVIDGYDTTPAGIALSVGIFGFTIGWQHLFDVVETAHEKLIESIDDAIVIVDPDMRFEEANDKAHEILSFLKNIPRGKIITDTDFINIILLGGMTEYVLNGRYYDIHVNEILSGTVLTGYSVVFFDVTEKKRQYDKMEELSRQAQSASDAKSAFLANVSHEIRTPINAVLGFNEVILRDYSEPKLMEYARSIQSSASTLLGLINQLLDFSKIESGKMNIINNVYDAEAMFKDIISVYKFRTEQEGLKFESEIDKRLPHFLYGDEIHIRQIITNLLANAIKYTNQGKVTLTVQFEKVSTIEGNLYVSVRDTGIGIKEEDINKLFEGFVRLEEDRNKFVQGTGLGLNICRNLVDMMEGELNVDSKYGEGSVFRAGIPQKLVDEKVIASEDGSSNRVLVKWERDFTAPKANVLIVDDNNINLKVAQALLAPTLVQLDMVSSGNACLDAICKKKYDIIFLDHRMPGMDGVETLHTMKHMHHLSDRAKVIALTANVVNDAKAFYLGAGFDDFLAKPVTEEYMDKMLKKHLDPSLIEKV